MARQRRPRIKDAVASGKSAADKANLLMDAAIEEVDALKDLLDDPEQLGGYLYEVLKGAIKAAKKDADTDEPDRAAAMDLLWTLVGRLLK